ncbi:MULTISPECIES: DUF47 family protein [Planococcus]|uniref:DUF47 domain-containing protein n=1 Tax=Planococcus faecalis TaxID=1598147 RepID=A0ABM6IQ66_9BACL|nr:MULTISPECIES: DUF47 family protein [Planococcus]AQU78692.1 hypothetical protein AJGP001_05105 [Planococcus faecalis]MDJ0332382.1 DUF47 family protein [Planococcus sp. S3-L1]OHX53888.1 hypothetical protein BB777_07740 [Planococcus faecalis]
MAFKKKDKFALQLSDIALNLKESAAYFAEYKLKASNDLIIFSNTMKDYETKGDSFIHSIIQDLNNAFITPIEREDILALAMSMDDVLDGLEHTAARFDMYSIVEADEYMLEFVEAIRLSTIEIEMAVELMVSKKLPQMRSHAIKIKDYESKCDAVLRRSIKNLFQTEKDPIRIIQYKDIYEELEEIADHCQQVANTFESIIMKNA